MATLPIKQPRRIDPSLLEVGDDISVEHPADRGMTVTIRGIIAKQMKSGQTRYFMTNEGATILAWEIGKKLRVKVTLFGRDATPQATLFDSMDEVRERIAG